MMPNVRCADAERLIAYVYGEDDPAERQLTESHLAHCRECAREIGELQAVRTQLAEWRTPEIDLGFRVIREPVVAPGRRRWSAPVPAWAASLAAVLVLAVAAGIANLEVRYGSDGVTMRTGWSGSSNVTSAPQSTGTRAAAGVGASMTDAAWRSALAETERRLRAQFERQGGAHDAAAAPAVGRDELLRQMRTLVDESERRQQRELAFRLTQLVQDMEAQRRADLVQIERNFGQIEGFTSAEVAQQRALLNHLVRVSEGR
jgi:anti-sigma factor RsiW